MEKELRTLSLLDIEPDPGQPRKTEPMTPELLDHLKSLGKSIKSEGLNNPIKVRPNPDPDKAGKFLIVNGECRWRASIMAGLETIAAFIDNSDRPAAEVFMEQIMDNDARLNMGIMETIDAYAKAVDMGISIERLAAAMGKSEQAIMNDLPIAKLPEKIRKLIDCGAVTKAVARKLAEFTGAKLDKAFEKAMKGKDAKSMLANIHAYEAQAAQTSLFDEAKQEAPEVKKNAGKAFDKLQKTVSEFANGPYSNGKGKLVVLARSQQLATVEYTAEQMMREGQRLKDLCIQFRAERQLAA